MAAIANTGDVELCLGKILASRGFATCPQLRRLLRHIVTLTLDGRLSDLKEFSLGVDVFGRPDSYDPKLDAIVRVHARRLRERLEVYYLEAGAEDPIRIEVAKGGYVATLHPRSGAAQPRAQVAHRQYRWLALVLAAALLTLGVLAAAIQPWQSSRSDAALPIDPLTTLPGQEDYPNWSADGRSFLFTWTGPNDGRAAIYTQKPGDQHPTRLTHSERDEYRPRLSRDGKRVAFFRRTGIADYAVVVLDRETGRESTLGSVKSSLYIGYVPGLDWAPDAEAIAVTEQDSPMLPSRVVLWSLRDGRHTPLTNPPTDTSGDLDVKFSPDGSHVAVLRNAKVDLVVVSLTGDRREQRVMSNDRAFRGIDWLDDSTLVAARLGDDDTRGLWKIPIGGGKPVRLTPPQAFAESPAFHPGTRQLAYADLASEIHIWKYSTATGKGVPLIVSTRFDGAPSLSPDEKQIAFLSTRSGHLEVWVASVEGSGERCLTSLRGTGHILTPPAWSPDGKLLAIEIRIDGNPDIYLLPTAGGPLRRLTSEPSHDYFPRFSHDGRFVYYGCDRTGRMELFRVPVEGGPPVRITQGGALMGWEYGDGGILFARVDRLAEFWREDFSGNHKTLLFEEAARPLPLLTGTVRNHSLFYLRQSGADAAQTELCRYDIDSGQRTSLASFDGVDGAGLGGMAGSGAMAVTSDGRFAYLPHGNARRSDLMRIEIPAR